MNHLMPKHSAAYNVNVDTFCQQHGCRRRRTRCSFGHTRQVEAAVGTCSFYRSHGHEPRMKTSCPFTESLAVTRGRAAAAAFSAESKLAHSGSFR